VLPESRSQSVAVQATQDSSFVGFRTAALDVRIERNSARLVIRDLAGNVISADAIGRPTKFQHGGFSTYKEMPGDEHYFGLGDKTGGFDRREQAYSLWNTDIGPQESVDPLYKSIPFFSPSTALAAMEFFWITHGAPGSILASPRAMLTPSAPKVARSTTTSSMGPLRSKS
jgi:alpha-glucosidase (family GH31 glycosyl hydrolase)